MFKKTKAFAIFAVLLCLNFNLYNISFAEDTVTQVNKYPDYAFEYLGRDKFESFNRKMFTFNSKLNKFVIKPVHIVYASVMPQFGMDRIKCACTNIEYPIRLTSCLIQRDLPASGRETLRFLTNTTIGVGGLFDPAKSLFHIEPIQEDMEQALAKCKVKSGPYLVVPILASTTPRGLAGKALDAALNPSSYIATPVIALVKAGLTLNKSTAIQPLAKALETTYADPYEVARKLYGLDNYIKNSNLDRKEVLDTEVVLFDGDELVEEPENEVKVTAQQEETAGKNEPEDKVALNEILKGGTNVDDIVLKSYDKKNSKLLADMVLFDYNPQSPVVDAMRTALFDLPGISDSIWNELSVWNRCFSKKIKTSSVSIDPERENYRYRYIMQKDKNAPVAIVYPSIGEGVMSYHSVVLAKLFYEEGYSVIIQGSHFQWEFVKSMPKEYKPGVPSNDADYLKIVTSKIINQLQAKYDCKFSKKILIGTSFGALETLFLADKESKNNTLGIDKFISINPPVELIYAMKQIDRNSEEWNKNPDNLKGRVAVTAAKVMRLYKMREDSPEIKISTLPFSEEEAKLITGFIMHQKLSDVVFTIEETSKGRKCSDMYNNLNNISYQDYAQKYLLAGSYDNVDELSYDASLYSIADYLSHNNNYKIYHSLDDYLVNHEQLKTLKQYSKNNTLLMSNGSHLGFLYRQEFIDDLRKEISLKNPTIAKGY